MSNLLSIAQRYTTLTHKRGADEWAGPCPRCGGVDRFIVFPDGRWLCRVGRNGKDGIAPTHPDLWGGDAVDLIRLAERVEYTQAKRILQSGDHRGAPIQPAQPAQKRKPFDVAQWSSNVAGCQTNLTPESAQGRYLLSRGLHPQTWAKFLLGAGYYTLKGQRYDSVVVPWHDRNRALIGVAHRLLNPPDYKRRYMVVGNKIGHLWGWRSHSGRYDVLYLVEGEINAMSVHQQCGADVLSVGSQNAKITPEQAATIHQWATIKLWADNPTIANQWRAVIGRGDVIRTHQDANEWLKSLTTLKNQDRRRTV